MEAFTRSEMTEEQNRKAAYLRVAALITHELSQNHGTDAEVVAELRRIQERMAAAGSVPGTANAEVAAGSYDSTLAVVPRAKLKR